LRRIYPGLIFEVWGGTINMSCETCVYRFECEHADKYYIPEEDKE